VVDETEADFRALIETDFGPLSPNDDFREALLNWLHFKGRSIPQRARNVVISPEVKAKLSQYPAIKQLRTELSKAGDLSPWLSDTIRRKAADARADTMFNDWQIIHSTARRNHTVPAYACALSAASLATIGQW
jgi:hypothetical protein